MDKDLFAVNLGDSNLFQLLWPVILIPVAYCFGRAMDSRGGPAPASAPIGSPTTIINDSSKWFSPEARAQAIAVAAPNVTVHVNASQTGGEDPWDELARIFGIALAVLGALVAVGLFFAGVRAIALSTAMAAPCIFLGLWLAGYGKLRRDGILNQSWGTMLAVALLPALVTLAALFAGLAAEVPGGRYEQVLAAFDDSGRAGLEGFGKYTTSVYFAFQAIFAIGLILVCLASSVAYGTLIRFRSGPPSPPPFKPPWGFRALLFGPRWTFVFYGVLACLCGVVVSGFAYNWSYASVRRGVDNAAPSLRAVNREGLARPTVEFTVDEVASAVLRLRRRDRAGQFRVVDSQTRELLPGTVRWPVVRRGQDRLRPGTYRWVLVVTDVAGNVTRTQSREFQAGT